MAKVNPVTDQTFEQVVIKAERAVLVDYWADWCAPCRQLAPIIDELAAAYGDRMDFVSMDTNTNTRVPVEQGVLGLPTIQILSSGQVVKSFTGSKTKATLLNAIAEYV